MKLRNILHFALSFFTYHLKKIKIDLIEDSFFYGIFKEFNCEHHVLNHSRCEIYSFKFEHSFHSFLTQKLLQHMCPYCLLTHKRLKFILVLQR